MLQLVEPQLEAPHNGLDPLGSLRALLGNVIVQALLPLQAGLGMALRMPLGKGIGAHLLQGLLVLRFDERRIGGSGFGGFLWNGFGAIDGAKLPLRDIAHLLARDEARVHPAAFRRRRRHHRLRSRSDPHPTSGARS